MDIGEQSINQFLAEIASAKVSPAGGSAAAVSGAIGASLCEMTCTHILNRDDTVENHSELTELRDDLRTQRSQLLQLAEQDADAIESVYPGSDADTSRAEIERTLTVPLSIAEVCLGVIENGAVIVEWNDRPVVADAKTGVNLAYGSLIAAITIVRDNVDRLEAGSSVEQMEDRVNEIGESAGDIIGTMPGISTPLDWQP